MYSHDLSLSKLKQYLGGGGPWKDEGQGAVAEGLWPRGCGRGAVAEGLWPRGYGRGAMAERGSLVKGGVTTLSTQKQKGQKPCRY